MKTFKVNQKIEVVCQSKSTKTGFNHTATLLTNDNEGITVKVRYYNRTWEKYRFETVLQKLLDKVSESLEGLTTWDKRCFRQMIKHGGRHDTDDLKTIAMVASLGNIFGKTKEDKNDWKIRMIKAGLENKGLIMPEDWNDLDEDDKEKRLDNVINSLL